MRLLPLGLSMLMLAGSGLPALALAQNYGFMRSLPASRFNDEDMRLHTEAITQALDAPETGKTVSWHNPATGNSGAATAAAGPREGCRSVTVDSKSNAGTAKNVFHLCKVDGKWKAEKT